MNARTQYLFKLESLWKKNTHTTIPNSILFRYLSFHDNNDFISAFLCLYVYFTFANEILCLTCELIINQ